MRPEERTRSLARRGSGVDSGGEGAASIGIHAAAVSRWCLWCLVAGDLGMFVGDGAEHAVGGVAAGGVVLVDDCRDRPSGLLTGGDTRMLPAYSPP